MAIEQEMKQYRQDYLNAKAQGQLPLRVYFTQPGNETSFLKYGKGNNKYGNGFYATGQTVDRNTQSMPPKFQHATSPELILHEEDFANRYDNNISLARRDNYVGVAFTKWFGPNDKPPTPEDMKKSEYFLFPETVPQDFKVDTSNSEELVDTYEIQGKTYTLRKKDRRWRIDGINKQFRNKKSAIQHLDEPYKFLYRGKSPESSS